MVATSTEHAFIDEWNQLARLERSRLRRLVRMGRQLDEPNQARLADAFARYQARRPWVRHFWLWFVPGLVLALGAAAHVHPIFVGVAIMLAAQAVRARHNLRRRARSAP